MKNKTIIKIVNYLLFACLFSSNIALATWHDRRAEGWVWFEEKPDPRVSKPKEEVLPPSKPPSECPKENPTPEKPKVVKKDPEKELEAFKKELERSLKIATWDPTPQNVAAYQKLQLIALDKSLEFGRVWQQNLLSNPSLDASIDSPNSYYGIQLQKTLRQQEKEQHFKNLAKNHVLLFLYEGGNLTSQATSQIVKAFAKKYQFELYGYALDHQVIADIENQPSVQTLIQQLNIKTFPSLFIFDVAQKQLIPIAYGMVAQEKIEDNTLIQLPYSKKVTHE